MSGSGERNAPPRPGDALVGHLGLPEEARAALGADSDMFGVGAAVLVVVEVDDEAERPEVAHLRPEGM
jgi:hypothetical protein